jgi:predicted HD phosphohydrolase
MSATGTKPARTYQACVDFCERWDQASFDPDYQAEPLEIFEPMVARVFARQPYDPAVLQTGTAIGLPPPGAAGRR